MSDRQGMPKMQMRAKINAWEAGRAQKQKCVGDGARAKRKGAWEVNKQGTPKNKCVGGRA